MTKFSVDLDRLDETVLRLRRFEAFIDDRLAEVDGRVRVLHGSWCGDAAAAQLEAHLMWLAGAQQMRWATAALRTAAATAHENYGAAVGANCRGWQG